MSWMFNIFIAILVFGYAGYILKKSIMTKKEGKCGSCELQKYCSTVKCNEQKHSK